MWKRYTRPQTLGQARSHVQHLQELPMTSTSSQVCMASVLVCCWCFWFWFVSRPGTVAISDSCILAFRWLWPLFISDVFFVCVFFTEFPLVFSRYSARLKEQGYCLKVSWTCSRSGASCLRLRGVGGGLYQGFMCVWTRVHCTDASEIPEQYKAWCVGIRQKPVESRDEMSAAAATAAIQLETDNTFAQRYAGTLFKSQ